MFSGPIRGGTRGGAAEFKWDDVKADKDREHYLGHSVMAAAGRWQKNKDIHWYSREQETSADAAARARADEIRKVKEAEEDALAVALGFEPAVRLTDEEREAQRLAKEAEKAAKAARKAERHAEKQVKKEIKEQLKAERRLARAGSPSSSSKPPREEREREHHHHHHRRRRSRSPRRDERERSPRREDRARSPHDARYPSGSGSGSREESSSSSSRRRDRSRDYERADPRDERGHR